MTQQQQQPGPGQVLQIYDQLPGENALWFGRFRAYLELGAARSIIGTYNAERAAAGKPPARDIPGGWTAASTKHKWVDRAAAWDAAAARAADEARADTIRQDAAARTREQIRDGRRQQQEEEEWELRALLIERAKEMLNTTLFTKKAIRDGKAIEVKPAKWSMFTAVQMMELACKLGRLSARMPVQPEPDDAGELGATFFETSGELESVLPAGSVPEMPADVAVKPPIGDTTPQAGRRGAPSQPRIERPADYMRNKDRR